MGDNHCEAAALPGHDGSRGIAIVTSAGFGQSRGIIARCTRCNCDPAEDASSGELDEAVHARVAVR